MSFKKGELVVLKSGGPTMTVADLIGDWVWCVWFQNLKKFDDSFDPDVLKLAESAAASFGSGTRG